MRIIIPNTIIVLLIITMVSCHSHTGNSSQSETNVLDSSKYPNKLGNSARFEHHEKYKAAGNRSEVEWDSAQAIVNPNDSQYHIRNNKHKFFGWHPYYMGSAYKHYNFKLLWGISYFGFIVDPSTGNYSSIYNWKTTAMVDMAKTDGCKVFLTVTNFGAANNTKLFNNPEAVSNLINQIDAALQLREADGVNIDFEEVPASVKTQFNDFLIALSQKIKSRDSKQMMTLALYAVDFGDVFNIAKLSPHVDLFTVMGYDYYYAGSKDAGPVSPLVSGTKWISYNLSKSVEYYLAQGAPKSKLLLALPYYGRQWKVASAKEPIPSLSKGYIKAPIWRDIIKQVDTSKAETDYVSMTRYIDSDLSGNEGQLWFDDVSTLRAKYKYVKSLDIVGVGIWALGYDNGYGELWQLAGHEFGNQIEENKK